MDDGPGCVIVLVNGTGLTMGGKVSLWLLMAITGVSEHDLKFILQLYYLEVVLQLVDNGTGRAEVTVLGLDLGAHMEGSLGFQVVLKGSNDVASSGGHGLVLALVLGLVGYGSGGEAKAGGAAVVRPELAILAAMTYFES
jgi:hypothetical protein